MNKVSLDEAIKFSKDLGSIIQKDFDPDIVISIREGGTLSGIEICDQLHKPLIQIIVKRAFDDTKLRKEYASATEEKRKEISKTFDKIWFETEPILLSEINLDLKNKKVLLVDDAVHTGKTLNVAKIYLSKFEPQVIKTAALFYADKVAPDYFIGQEEKSYPWSTYAKFNDQYPLYEEYLKKHAQLLP